MSILDTAVSGMIANTNWLTTIAQNVANANTTGYKNVETQFSALVDTSQNLDSQFGGVTTTTRALNSLQGQNQETSTTTDLAVQGAGYFIVEDSGGDIYLTRDGSFVPDASGNLVNAAGYYLLGSPSSQTGVALNSLSGLQKVNVADASDTSIPSTAATLVANLPSTSTRSPTPPICPPPIRLLQYTPPKLRSSPMTTSEPRTRSIFISPMKAATSGKSTPSMPLPRRRGADFRIPPAPWRREP